MGFFSELPWKKGSRETNIDKALLSLVSVEKYLMALKIHLEIVRFLIITKPAKRSGEEFLQLISSNISTINKGLKKSHHTGIFKL